MWSLAFAHIAVGFDLGFSLRMSLDNFVPISDLGMAPSPYKDILAASRFVIVPPRELTQSLVPCHLVHIFAFLHHLQHLDLVLEAAGPGQGVPGSSFCFIVSPSIAARTSYEHPAACPSCRALQLLLYGFVCGLVVHHGLPSLTLWAIASG